MASTIAQATLSDAKTGVGVTVDLGDAKRSVTAVLSASGSVTGGLITVEASQDATNWVPRHVFVTEGDTAQGYDSATGAYRYWRASVSEPVAGGGTVTVTFMESDR